MVKVTYSPTPKYENPLASKLGLRSDDLKRESKLFRLLTDLRSKIQTPVQGHVDWHFQQVEVTGALPLPKDWRRWPILTSRSVWGESQKHTWLVAEIIVPEEAEGRTFALKVSSNWRPMQGSTDPQCLVHLDGKIAQALDGNHTELVIVHDAQPGSAHVMQINAFTFDERPMVGFETELFVRNERIEALYQDLATSFEVAIRLLQSDNRRHAMLERIENALYALDRREGQEDGLFASLPMAEDMAGAIYKLAADEQQPTISAFGHTHLDVAWLWRVKHVRDKTARTFATVLNLMDEFPEFVFMYNQAVLFDFLKRDYPEIWARLKEKVQNGQFEIEGAMWVEPDVNISSGESLIRQIMYGRQFLIDEFDVTPKCVWLPDTFGYSAALPQIFVKSGIEYFVTSKLSWNDTDRQPYDSFFWRGIDGSTIKSQLITTQAQETEDHRTIYNSDFSVSDILGTWKRYEPKALNDHVMMCYGYGDGGGGPTRDMIQRGIRLNRGIPGAPKLRMEGLRPFLDRLGERMDARIDAFPTWDGELYLQYHRGTLTSVAKNKKNNRNAERAMRELEFAATLASLRSESPYPRDAIRELWKVVLINQFHDILPGTSIASVYEDCDEEYAAFFATMESSQGPMQTALSNIFTDKAGQVQLLNTTGQCRDGEMIAFKWNDEYAQCGIATALGENNLQSILRADGEQQALAPIATLPPLGWSNAKLCDKPKPPLTSLKVSPGMLENDKVKVCFNDEGEITSIFEKKLQRELVQEGKCANQLIAYEDKPKNYDAWDIDHYFEDKQWQLNQSTVSVEVIETGPYRAAIRVNRQYAQSRIVQIISLQEGSKQIEFDTEVNWRERQTLLKAGFPLDLNVSETRAEIQFGHVRRPSHRNTSWDQARFECSMHRWVDMSEPDFGAALLTDCKYGYDAHQQNLRLTLLKGPKIPDPTADIGLHHFRYALLLHAGEHDLTSVVHAAERFNNPILVSGEFDDLGKQHPLGKNFSLVCCNNENLTIETVKLAEADQDVILRIYEHANQRAHAQVRFGVPVSQVIETDLMERNIDQKHELNDDTIELSFRPFEIKTLKVTVR